jgi:hypothetical protein
MGDAFNIVFDLARPRTVCCAVFFDFDAVASIPAA